MRYFTLLLPLAFCLAPSYVLCGDCAAETRPNIVFILADDLGWRDLGCYGSTFYETPKIDRMCRRGMKFPNAYAASPLCSPTRASLLTGQYPARHRITTPACHLPRVVLDPTVALAADPARRVIQPGTRTRLPNELITYAEVLKGGRYQTAFLGKWHLGKEPYLPENQGFDFVVGGRGFPGPPGGYFAPWPIDTLPKAPEGTHIDDVVTTEAIRFLETAIQKGQPFLLNLWYYSVHAPFEAKAELIEKYRAKAKQDPHNRQASPVMAAMIETLDTNVGRIMEALNRLGLSESTIVLFTSDNGGNNYNFADGVQVTTNAPLRNGKGNIHEGGQRVPFIALWPGSITAGATNHALISSVDFFPSIIKLARLDRPDQRVDGQSFVGLLTGEQQPNLERAVFTHFPHGPPATGSRPSTSVRRGDWKLLRFYADGDGQQDRHALYDLTEDIGETKDLSTQQSDVVRELSALLDEHLAQTEALLPRANPRWKPDHDGWKPSRDASLTLDRTNGVLKISSTGTDPFIRTGYIKAGKGRLTVELRVRSTLGGRAALYFADQRQPFARERSVSFPIRHDGQWHCYRVGLEVPRPLGQLRFDPGSAPGQVEIDWLRAIQWTSESGGKVVMHWDF